MSIRNTYLIRRHPAFQAGCRGFESRLPLPSIDRLCAGRSQADWEQPGGDTVSKEAVFLWAKRRAATSCLDFARYPVLLRLDTIASTPWAPQPCRGGATHTSAPPPAPLRARSPTRAVPGLERSQPDLRQTTHPLSSYLARGARAA